MYLRWKDKGDKWITVQFDSVSRETVESVLSITTHPVEDGSDITDHAHLGPTKITVEGYISNKPLPSNPGVFFGTSGQEVYKGSSLSLQAVPLNLKRYDGVVFEGAGETAPSFLDSVKGVLGKASPGGITKIVTGGIDGLLHPRPTDAHVYQGNQGWEDRAKRIYELLLAAQGIRARITCGIKLATVEDMLIAKLSAPRSKGEGSGATFNLELQRIRVVKNATVAAPLPAENRGQEKKPEGPKPAEVDESKDKKKVAVGLQLSIKAGAQQAKK